MTSTTFHPLRDDWIMMTVQSSTVLNTYIGKEEQAFVWIGRVTNLDKGKQPFNYDQHLAFLHANADRYIAEAQSSGVFDRE